MNLVFVSAEAAPFSKAGGLADVAGSLPEALTPYLDSVTTITPLYGQIDTEKHNILATGERGHIDMGEETFHYALHQLNDPDATAHVIFIECAPLFGRQGIYTKANGEGFDDNNIRYFFFQLVVLDVLTRGIVKADLLHCNDHHTGLLPLLLKDTDLSTRTVFTIHNFLYHGHFSVADCANLPDGIVKHLTRTQWDNFSALLEGIDHSDVVTTVSPGYAKELIEGINVDAHSHTILQRAIHKFSGIVNGIDTSYWNPEKDQYTPHHYSAENIHGKMDNKLALLKETGLDADTDAPLFGSISRLVENKGFPLIVDLLDEFVALGAKFVFLGSGDPVITDQLQSAQQKHPGRIAFDAGFNEPLAHLIEAGSDIFLMPSRFEPCGLNQLYSLRYGTIPLVNRTGGLGDTVSDYKGNDGTGFVFEPYELDALRNAMKRTLQVFKSEDQWSSLIQRAMAEDFSWDQSAKQYYNLYKS